MRAGEDLAARWYEEHGYEVLERNWRRREGEVDLIVRRGPTVVFCEVKTRSSDRFGTGAESVLPAKQRRIRRLASRWLSELTPAVGPGPGGGPLRRGVDHRRRGRRHRGCLLTLRVRTLWVRLTAAVDVDADRPAPSGASGDVSVTPHP